MKNFLSKINTFLKSCVPVLLLLAVILGIVNLVYMNKVESDVETVQSEVNSVKREVNNMSTDVDNSEVLNAIDDAESNIEGSVDAAARKIQGSIMIWSN